MSLQAISKPSKISGCNVNELIDIPQLAQHLSLIAEGLLRTEYAFASGLPAHLREEGLQQQQLYIDMLINTTKKISSKIGGNI